MLIRSLLIGHDPETASSLATVLRDLGVDVSSVKQEGEPSEVLRRLVGQDVDLLLIDSAPLGDAPERVIDTIRQLPDAPEVVVVTDQDDPRSRGRLLAAGCLAVLSSETTASDLAATLRNIVDRRRQDGIARLRADHRGLPPRLSDFSSQSPAMQQFVEVARRVVDASSSLLILGETGVGKERLARAIHAEGPRANGPFVAVNCGALPEALVESELFGHERGAFTGAVAARRGYFELAHGGTIFLDEVAEIPAHLQVKLLRVLEERAFARLGSERQIRVDVRVMAATNRDLEEEMAAGRFREDLYYRLAVVSLALPPLRARREDVPGLVDAYLAHFRTVLGRDVISVREEAMAALSAYDWPGNLRELVNVVEQTVLLCRGSDIGLSDLPRRVAEPRLGSPDAGRFVIEAPGDEAVDLGRSLPDAKRDLVHSLERAYLIEALRRSKGRVGEAALRIGVSPRTVHALMRRHGVAKERFRPG